MWVYNVIEDEDGNVDRFIVDKGGQGPSMMLHLHCDSPPDHPRGIQVDAMAKEIVDRLNFKVDIDIVSELGRFIGSMNVVYPHWSTKAVEKAYDLLSKLP